MSFSRAAGSFVPNLRELSLKFVSYIAAIPTSPHTPPTLVHHHAQNVYYFNYLGTLNLLRGRSAWIPATLSVESASIPLSCATFDVEGAPASEGFLERFHLPAVRSLRLAGLSLRAVPRIPIKTPLAQRAELDLPSPSPTQPDADSQAVTHSNITRLTACVMKSVRPISEWRFPALQHLSLTVKHPNFHEPAKIGPHLLSFLNGNQIALKLLYLNAVDVSDPVFASCIERLARLEELTLVDRRIRREALEQMGKPKILPILCRIHLILHDTWDVSAIDLIQLLCDRGDRAACPNYAKWSISGTRAGRYFNVTVWCLLISPLNVAVHFLSCIPSWTPNHLSARLLAAYIALCTLQLRAYRLIIAAEGATLLLACLHTNATSRPLLNLRYSFTCLKLACRGGSGIQPCAPSPASISSSCPLPALMCAMYGGCMAKNGHGVRTAIVVARGVRACVRVCSPGAVARQADVPGARWQRGKRRQQGTRASQQERLASVSLDWYPRTWLLTKFHLDSITPTPTARLSALSHLFQPPAGRSAFIGRSGLVNGIPPVAPRHPACTDGHQYFDPGPLNTALKADRRTRDSKSAVFLILRRGTLDA
ncbi:hypothetical protein BOTBODRAFT_44167 [Botryobasidium botryosum FD-172 SS1]|uniref:Uncharacterized protein n=1 Tax=Botryobasidium botryosum (strain FD-172 SS1) TaxID=930990 RepID=A0A067MI20_BOTB1|nr:hypothetical protein BOTBODRAFT_44167 [Botryobasidium botryosum FD-172 SS1]